MGESGQCEDGACVECAGGATFCDSTFDDDDWAQLVVVIGRGGSSSAVQVLDGGNPGAYRRVEQQRNAPSSTEPAGVYSVNLKIDAIYSPAVQGAIESIDYSEDAIAFAGSFNVQQTGPALCQDGSCYVRGVATVDPFDTWQTVQTDRLSADDFYLLDPDVPPVGIDETKHPDFSASGATIEFGFYRANRGFPGTPATDLREAGIDNWSITVDRAP
jgi:hypothetical protein